MAKAQQREINAPLKGLSEGTSYDDQPKGSYDQARGSFVGGTTPRAVNVYGYDPRTGRRRLSSRCGTSKYCSAAVNGTRAIQDINHVVGVVEGDVNRTLEDGTLRTQENGTFRILEATSTANTGERLVTLLAVAGGSVYSISTTAATLVTNGGGALRADAYTIFSTPCQLDLYFCDGTNYRVYDVSSAAMTTWSASAGTMPTRATLICLWNGRIVLSGCKGDPQNWFMSAVDGPRDWDYSPTSLSDTMAVAGNNSPAGLVGDIVTGLVPFSDDTLVIGGVNTIWRMDGDPAAGGRISRVSSITGMAWGRAFCTSPEGVLYFVGSRGGIFKMDPNGGVPQRLTAFTLDERFADLNMDDNLFRLAWDDRAIAVRIFITPKDGSATSHYRYDLRTDSWWEIQYANADHNPLAVHLFDGYSSAERVIMLGGQDSYIRSEDVDATTDDGSPIAYEVFLGPMQDQTVLEWQATFSNESGNVDWSLHTATELQTALDAAACANGRFTSGRNRSQWPRRHLQAGYLRLSGSEPMSLEKLVATIEPDGEQRRRIF